MIETEKYYIDGYSGLIFAPHKNDPYESRKKDWILNKLLDNVGNINRVNKLLDLVATVYPAWKNEVIIEYLKHDTRIENFRKLHLFPMIESWSGSYIPLINRKIVSLENLRNALVGLEYIEHKVYLEELINEKQLQREEFKKREYLDCKFRYNGTMFPLTAVRAFRSERYNFPL